MYVRQNECLPRVPHLKRAIDEYAHGLRPSQDPTSRRISLQLGARWSIERTQSTDTSAMGLTDWLQIPGVCFLLLLPRLWKKELSTQYCFGPQCWTGERNACTSWNNLWLPGAPGESFQELTFEDSDCYFSIIQYCVLQTESQWNLPWCPRAGLVTSHSVYTLLSDSLKRHCIIIVFTYRSPWLEGQLPRPPLALQISPPLE